jgi:hypothetical protein
MLAVAVRLLRQRWCWVRWRRAHVVGTTSPLIGNRPLPGGVSDGDRDPQLSAAMREALINVHGFATHSTRTLVSRALDLDAALSASDCTALPLRPTELALLHGWPDRLSR